MESEEEVIQNKVDASLSIQCILVPLEDIECVTFLENKRILLFYTAYWKNNQGVGQPECGY